MSKLRRTSQTTDFSKPGFTIVELLVVIVVIGILATITIVAYTGITNRAIASSLQSDLANASNQLRLYNVDNGAYPTANQCPTPSAGNICLKSSSGNSFAYQPNTSNYQSYILLGGNINGTDYSTTDNSAPVQTSMGILNGSEAWGQDNSFTNTTTFYLSAAGRYPYGLNPICSFPFTTKTDSEGSNYSGAGYFEIRILKSRLTTVDVAGFKTWLSSNNISVVINN